jgi:hypothetical protein
MIVAKAAWNRGAPRKILGHEGAYDFPLEALFVIDHIVRNADVFGDPAGVINVVKGAAAAGHGLRHALVSGHSALVPELHGETDNVVPFGAQHGRDGGRIYTA